MGRELTALAFVSLFLLSVVGIGVATTIDDPGAVSAVPNQSNDSVGPMAQANESMATITVSGSGEVTAEADQALVFVAVSSTDTAPSEATTRLANETAVLRDSLETVSSVQNVTTTDYRLFERRENRTRSFVARQSFQIVVNRTDTVGEVVDVAVAGGATEVNGVSFTLSEERQRGLRETAIDRAVADARSQADAVAASTDLTIQSVRSVSTGGGFFSPVQEARPTAASGTVIDSGPVTVSASVQITYEAGSSGDS